MKNENIRNITENIRGLHESIANDVWGPDGWTFPCKQCGQNFTISLEMCAHYLAHGGWVNKCHQCRENKGE